MTRSPLNPSNIRSTFERAATTPSADRYVLRLYVTGMTPRSARAVNNLRAICDEYLEGRYDLEVIDIYQQPVLTKGEQIIAAPTLIKKLPLPMRRPVDAAVSQPSQDRPCDRLGGAQFDGCVSVLPAGWWTLPPVAGQQAQRRARTRADPDLRRVRPLCGFGRRRSWRQRAQKSLMTEICRFAMASPRIVRFPAV